MNEPAPPASRGACHRVLEHHGRCAPPTGRGRLGGADAARPRGRRARRRRPCGGCGCPSASRPRRSPGPASAIRLTAGPRDRFVRVRLRRVAGRRVVRGALAARARRAAPDGPLAAGRGHGLAACPSGRYRLEIRGGRRRGRPRGPGRRVPVRIFVRPGNVAVPCTGAPRGPPRPVARAGARRRRRRPARAARPSWRPPATSRARACARRSQTAGLDHGRHPPAGRPRPRRLPVRLRHAGPVPRLLRPHLGPLQVDHLPDQRRRRGLLRHGRLADVLEQRRARDAAGRGVVLVQRRLLARRGAQLVVLPPGELRRGGLDRAGCAATWPPTARAARWPTGTCPTSPRRPRARTAGPALQGLVRRPLLRRRRRRCCRPTSTSTSASRRRTRRAGATRRAGITAFTVGTGGRSHAVPVGRARQQRRPQRRHLRRAGADAAPDGLRLPLRAGPAARRSADAGSRGRGVH